MPENPAGESLEPGRREDVPGFLPAALWRGLILLGCGLLAASCFRVPVDADSFFHLATARNWFELGMSPFVDHLSFTYPGEAVRGQPIVFQAMLYGYVAALGLHPGFIAMKLTFMLLTVATVAWLIRRTQAPWPVAAFVIALLVFALQTRVQTRPELGIFWFMTLAFVLYHRALASEGAGVTAKNMIPVALLTMVWVAWYSSIFAYVVFFGLFVDLAIKQWSRGAPPGAWVRWLAWGAVVFVLGWGPPDFTHDFFSTLTFSREWVQAIQEWEAPVRYLRFPGTWVLAVSGFVALLLAVRSRRIGLLVVLVVFMQQTIQISRFIAPAGIVIACSLLILLELQRSESLERRLPGIGRKGWSALALALTLLTVLSSGFLTAKHLTTGELRGSVWPRALAGHLRTEWAPGRIFNTMLRGGYLAWELGPDFPIYIDGRVNLLYPLEFFRHHLAVTRSADALEPELDRYDVDYLVVPDDATSDQYLHDLQGWTLDFVDVNDLLFVRAGGRFPLSGVLRYAPECWSPEWVSGLSEELEVARTLLPEPSRHAPLIEQVLLFEHGDVRAGTARPSDQELATNWRAYRLLAYRAFNEGENELAIGLLSDLPYRYFKDGLVLAMAYLRIGQRADAARVFQRLLSEPWRQLHPQDLAVASSLLAALDEQQALPEVDSERARAFFQEAGHWPPGNDAAAFRTADLCYRDLP